MQINEIKVQTARGRKRVGRGGKRGTYSGRGMKGQKSRSGFKKRATFEGGASSLVQHTKKNRGFKKEKNSKYIFNLDDIENKFKEGEILSPKTLKEKKLIRDITRPVKILADGELTKKIIFEEVLISKSAEGKIKKAGGKIEKTKINQ